MFKGLYYNHLLKIVGKSLKHLHIKQIEQIYYQLQNIVDHPIIKNEFIFSMEWVLADTFRDGTEVIIPDEAFDFLK